jgi:ATP-dependent RNA helicase DOB1
VPVTLSTLDGISHVRLFLSGDLKPVEERNSVLKSIMEVKKRFPEGIPQLDPIENMGIKDEGFKKLVRVSHCLD